MRRKFGWLGLAALMSGLCPAAVQACAVCLTAAAGEDRTVAAFNWSVLFLMSMPYAVLSAVAGFLFYAHRRAARKRNPAKRKARVYHLAWSYKESGR